MGTLGIDKTNSNSYCGLDHGLSLAKISASLRTHKEPVDTGYPRSFIS
jgi:hypothetical protein